MAHYHRYLRALGRGGVYVVVALAEHIVIVIVCLALLFADIVAVDGVGARAGYADAAPLFGAGAGALACGGAYGGHAGVVGGHVAAGGAGGVVIVVVGLLFHHGAAGEGEILGAHKAAGAVIVRIQEAAGAVSAQHGEGLAPHIAQLGSALGGAGGGRADVDVVVLGYGALGRVVHLHAGGGGGARGGAAGGQVGEADRAGAAAPEVGDIACGYPAGDAAAAGVYGDVYLACVSIPVMNGYAAASAYPGRFLAVVVYDGAACKGRGKGTAGGGGIGVCVSTGICVGVGADACAAAPLILAEAGDGALGHPSGDVVSAVGSGDVIHAGGSVLPVDSDLTGNVGQYLCRGLGLLVDGGLRCRNAIEGNGEGGKCGQHHQRQHGHCYDADNSLFHKRFPFRMSSYFSFSRDTSSSSSNTKAARRGS